METLALSNVAAYTAQVICVVTLAGMVSWLLRMDVPLVRYAYWRALLGLCLVLPLLQGREAPGPGRNVSVTIGVTDVATTGTGDPAATRSGLTWTPFVLPFLVAGAAVRLLWIGASLQRLRRLRRAGDTAPHSEIQDELEAIIGTRCEVRYLERLKQPVTFGLWRPVILLPAVLFKSDPEMQRAVLSHELFHVKRRDWAWLVAEEVVCAVLWFNPAVWWTVSRVHLAREAVVDELAVLATGRRRAYVQALIAFADETSLAPVAAFGSQRQLFNRIVLLSKEGVMSSHRLVITCAVMAAVVITGSWQAVRAFPLAAAPATQVIDQKTPGPLEQRANPISPENPIPRRVMYEAPVFPPEARDAGARGSVTLMITLDELGRVAEVRSAGLTVTSKTPPLTLTRRGGNPEAGAMFRIEGSVEQAHVVRAIAAAFTDSAIRAVGQWRYDPPAAAPISFPVTINFSPGGPTAVQGAAVKGHLNDPGPLPADGAIRVGGNVSTPVKTRDVRPLYPAEARAARISGMVILELRISPEGLVEDARVLRSIPMLDQAAIDAVMQWRFAPTLLNGRRVPVIVTVTVNFVLDPQVSVSSGAVIPDRQPNPKVLKEVKPVYPRDALQSGAQGSVEVEVTIGTDGKVIDSRVIRSTPIFDDAALAAARQWEFSPVAQPVAVTIEMTFSTRRKGGA